MHIDYKKNILFYIGVTPDLFASLKELLELQLFPLSS